MNQTHGEFRRMYLWALYYD